ncbi:MAG: uroporphyrinogen decarboxylase family protein [Planctomycetia bacterium]|nr:uroporphyrinogen decarboxylase family protein [Planctomycetia bacterium]
MSRKSEVDRAIGFQGPSRIPIWVDGGNLRNSDVLTYDLSMGDEDNPRLSEWGFERLRSPSGDWLIPKAATLPEWQDVDAYQAPPMNSARRLAGIAKAATVCGDRYRIASFGMSGFSIYRALRGAELSAVDFLIESDRFIELMELIFDFEVAFFDLLSRKGFHAIEFCDDWGDRATSRVTLSLWRTMLKAYYARQFRRAKESGLHVWFSTPSQCAEFFGDLKEIGADVVRVDAPYDVELASLGRAFRGKLCFAVRLDEIVGETNDDLSLVQHIYECLATKDGGFIATVADGVNADRINKIVRLVNKLTPPMI